jgi:hypothetical protein
MPQGEVKSMLFLSQGDSRGVLEIVLSAVLVIIALVVTLTLLGVGVSDITDWFANLIP